MAFGSGILVSALTFDLMEEAFETGGVAWVVGGFALGALVYVVLDYLLDRMAAGRRSARAPRPGRRRGGENDGRGDRRRDGQRDGAPGRRRPRRIPENTAIGVSLSAENSALGIILLLAVFLGNFPESISSSVGMRQEGRPRGYILGVWAGAAIVCTLAAVLGYAVLGGLSQDLISGMLALAAGGILAMLADTMMPEAFENGGPFVALGTAIGFMCAFLLSHYVG